jgi:hypothetical protein
VDHSAPSPDTLLRPWRIVAVVAAGVAAVELVLLIAAGTVLFGRSVADRASSEPKKTKPPVAARAEKTKAEATPRRPVKPRPVPKAKLSRAQTSLLVLNGNGQQGAAGAEATRARARGYAIRAVGNARHTDHVRTVVMYRPGFEGEARRLARDLRIGLVSPLDGMKPSQLRGAQLAIVLGVR